MQKALNLYTLALAAFLTVAVFTSYSNKDKAPAPSSAEPGPVSQVIRPVDLDKAFDFAGESLPMDNFDVRERLDRELLVNTYWHSSTVLNIKNTVRYFPVIERILAQNNIPEDFKYLAVAESSLRNVVSPAGARGVWQFMEPAAEANGLEINDEVDERYHLEKATQAAADKLRRLKERFGSWTLAAAAYNVGETRLSKELKAQRADTYYELNLNPETMRYIFRLVAIKEILQHPQDFGFYLDRTDGYPPLENYHVVEVNQAIENLGDFAREHGISYRMLKVYNPWLIDSRLTNASRKTYRIKIPNQKF